MIPFVKGVDVTPGEEPCLSLVCLKVAIASLFKEGTQRV